MIKVSIVVPVYNVENYLKRCLDSLVNQTLKDIEIICVNDGSKDSSLEILKEYAQKDSRIRVINQENQGQSVARNVAIEHAQGEYLAFVDSDDWVDLDFFEKLYNAAFENNCDIACSGFKRVGRFRSSIRKSYKEINVYNDINDKVKVDKIPKHNYIWNKIYKRESWQKTGIEFTPGRYFEDVALLTPILYSMGSMVTVPNTYYNYWKNPNSTVTLATEKHKTDNEWARAELNKFAQEHNIKIGSPCLKKEYINPFVKVYYYKDMKKYKLFGFIPVLKKPIS